MATESDVVVGSKWRYNDDHPTPRLRGEVRTVTAVRANGHVDTEEFGRFTTYVDVLTRYATRIDQPPEKAGEDVPPVGSRWKFKGSGEVWKVEKLVDGMAGIRNESAPVEYTLWPVSRMHDDATRLDTPQEAAPAAPAKPCTATTWERWAAATGHELTPSTLMLNRSCAKCGGEFKYEEADGWENGNCGSFSCKPATLQQGAVPSEKNMRSLINSFRRDEGLREVCLTSCGPASPCLTTTMCRERDARERRAYLHTPSRDYVSPAEAEAEIQRVHELKRAYRTGPPEPARNGYGSLTGVYRVSVERHRRVRP